MCDPCLSKETLPLLAMNAEHSSSGSPMILFWTSGSARAAAGCRWCSSCVCGSGPRLGLFRGWNWSCDCSNCLDHRALGSSRRTLGRERGSLDSDRPILARARGSFFARFQMVGWLPAYEFQDDQPNHCSLSVPVGLCCSDSSVARSRRRFDCWHRPERLRPFAPVLMSRSALLNFRMATLTSQSCCHLCYWSYCAWCSPDFDLWMWGIAFADGTSGLCSRTRTHCGSEGEPCHYPSLSWGRTGRSADRGRWSCWRCARAPTASTKTLIHYLFDFSGSLGPEWSPRWTRRPLKFDFSVLSVIYCCFDQHGTCFWPDHFIFWWVCWFCLLNCSFAICWIVGTRASSDIDWNWIASHFRGVTCCSQPNSAFSGPTYSQIFCFIGYSVFVSISRTYALSRLELICGSTRSWSFWDSAPFCTAT